MDPAISTPAPAHDERHHEGRTRRAFEGEVQLGSPLQRVPADERGLAAQARA